MIDENENEIRRKVGAYYLLAEKVHISFKKKYWARGIITKIEPHYFILDETLQGKMVVLFSEVEDIEKFRGVKK